MSWLLASQKKASVDLYMCDVSGAVMQSTKFTGDPEHHGKGCHNHDHYDHRDDVDDSDDHDNAHVCDDDRDDDYDDDDGDDDDNDGGDNGDDDDKDENGSCISCMMHAACHVDGDNCHDHDPLVSRKFAL